AGSSDLIATYRTSEHMIRTASSVLLVLTVTILTAGCGTSEPSKPNLKVTESEKGTGKGGKKPAGEISIPDPSAKK
ncbi:MAG: hypothetical protein ACRC33_17935, partial [Gemmataceae bacterium]